MAPLPKFYPVPFRNISWLPLGESFQEGTFYALQEVQIGKDVRSLPIAASFQIVKDYRHKKNPYGLQLTDFDFIAYSRQPKKD